VGSQRNSRELVPTAVVDPDLHKSSLYTWNPTTRHFPDGLKALGVGMMLFLQGFDTDNVYSHHGGGNYTWAGQSVSGKVGSLQAYKCIQNYAIAHCCLTLCALGS
jgi:hypothetical protein